MIQSSLARRTLCSLSLAMAMGFGIVAPVAAEETPYDARFPLLAEIIAPVNTATISGNGDWVVYEGLNDQGLGEVTAHNWRTGEIRSTEGLEPDMYMADWVVTPDASKVVIEYVSGVYVWDTAAGTQTPVGDRSSVRWSAGISPDGRYVSVEDWESGSDVYDMATGQVVFHSTELVVFASDGDYVELFWEDSRIRANRIDLNSAHQQVGSSKLTIAQMCDELVLSCNVERATARDGWDDAATNEIALYIGSFTASTSGDVFVDYYQSRIEVRDGSATTATNLASATTLHEVTHAWDYTPGDAEVTRLYQAYFARTPDVGGVVYWIGLQHEGHALADIAVWMSDSEEFRNLYEGTDNATYVSAIYENVLGRAEDPDGYAYWLGLLDAGELDRAGVVYWVTQNTEFINSYPFTPIYLAQQ